MTYIFRKIEPKIKQLLKNRKSILLLGPRQTGKTTLLSQLNPSLSLNLLEPRLRNHYERDPQYLDDEIKALSQQNPLILIDEIQKVPALLDVIQYIIDQNRAQFILTGSSARKLRRNTTVNLLPGRLIPLRLDPFSYTEYPDTLNLQNILEFGDLPRIATYPKQHSTIESKIIELNAYVSTYLEEEIRAEALVRNMSIFIKFLELAAIESGNIINYSKLSQDIGVSATTIQSYFDILEDCLIIEKIPAFTKTTSRTTLAKSPKYLMFDTGVRHHAAKDGHPLGLDKIPKRFEEWIGLQLIRLMRQHMLSGKLYYWRDHNGPEIDWILSLNNVLIPIEVKWTSTPTQKDIKHLRTFCSEHATVSQCYIVCNIPFPKILAPNITAIPFTHLEHVLDIPLYTQVILNK